MNDDPSPNPETESTMPTETHGDDRPRARPPGRDAVAIVTGGSFGAGREVARALASWGWAIVVVYLEHQRRAEATVAEILAAEGSLFAESSAAFAGVDVVVHTMADRASLLYEHAARHVRRRGAIVIVTAADSMTPAVTRQLQERGISVGRAPPEEVLPFLDRWRQAIG